MSHTNTPKEINSKILFKFTTRSRPHLFERGMDSIINNVWSDDYMILVSVDDDDLSMEAALKKYKENQRVKILSGVSTSKIDAINRDVKYLRGYYEWDILVNMSDDMIFIEEDFDLKIRKAIKEVDNEYACIHFPDGNKTDIITMSIMNRAFYEKFGYIYNPAYKSLFCDNEQTEVAKILGAYRFVDENIFQHLHPAFGKAQIDAQYQHTESFWSEDQNTYNIRKANNFDLKTAL